MPFSFSPYDQLWVAVVALSAWLWLIRLGRPLLTGFAFGFGWFGTGAWWLGWTLHTFADFSWLASLIAVILLGCVLAVFPMLWAWLAWKTAGRGSWILLSFPFAAVISEWLRGHLILSGLPWTALGNLMLDTPAVGWGAWFGVYGLAMLPALAAAGIVLALSGRVRTGGLALLAIVLLSLCSPVPFDMAGPGKQAALIQGNIPEDMKWGVDFMQASMSNHIKLSAGVADKADVIVWPEAAIPFFLERSPEANARLGSELAQWQTPLLYGSLKWISLKASRNGMFAYDPRHPEPDPAKRPFVGKHHLVPFGEYAPWWLPFFDKLVHGHGDYMPDEGSGVLTLDGVDYGALICYESLFPGESRMRVLNGAQVLVNISNDAWFGTTPAVRQSFQSARMRAVETGRYLLRAANTGITAIIRSDGSIEKSVPWWTQNALVGSYRLSDRQTPYVRWGDWPLLLCPMALALMFWLRSGYATRLKRKHEKERK